MKDLRSYIAQLRSDKELWPKVNRLVEHIAYLEAELRLARLRLDDARKEKEVEGEESHNPKFSSVKQTTHNEELSLEERNLYRAVGELAFVIAKADNILRDSEVKAFKDAITEVFGKDYWIIEDRFRYIISTPASDVESTYNHVLFMIRQNKAALNEILVEKFSNVLYKVAEVANIHDKQKEYLDRFKADLLHISSEM